MATYGTDLAVLATGSLADGSGTWTELIAPYALGGSAAADTENYIQGSQSESQTLGNKTGLGFSVVFDAGSDISGSFATDDVVLAWVFFTAGAALDTYANGGHRYVIAGNNTTLAADSWDISGNDRPPNPYGGWWNVAIDPTLTPDYTDGGGNGGAYQWFGSIVNILAKISKGTPHAVDAQRFGRGEIYCTGTGATFTLMAADNDAASARWGLLQNTGGGTFLWKGLMSLGQSGTSTTFAASNQTIVIDDTAKVYASFNKIEIRNASSSITWDNISITARGTVSPGRFEMVENAATMAWTGCSFNNMDTFIFLSNAVLIGCIWNGCGVITHGGADFEGCSFAGYEGTADTAYLIYNGTTDIDGELDNCSFAMGTALTHAISFTDNTIVEHTLRGIDFSGYGAENTNSSALYFPDSGSDQDWIINLIGCTGTITFKKVRAGDTVTLVVSPVTLLVHVQDDTTLADIQYAAVTVTAATTGSLPFQDSVTITRSGSVATVAHTAHGLATGEKVVISGANQNEYNRIKTITFVNANSYTFVVNGTPTTPATGTIIATAIIIDGETDVNGEISNTRSYSADQDYTILTQQGTRIPIYAARTGAGTIDKDNGKTENVFLTKD